MHRDAVLAARRGIVLDTPLPQYEAGTQKQDAEYGCKVLKPPGGAQGISDPQYPHHGEIADARQRHDKGEEAAKGNVVNGHGILRRLHTPLSQRIHDFEGFGSPKRQRRLHDNEPEEQTGPAEDRKEH